MRDYQKNPPKVCIICHGLGSGGIESFVVSLATGLKKKAFDVKLVMALDDNGIPQFREQEIEETGIEMFRTSDLGTVKRLFNHCIRLYKYLQENHFDVVHTNMSLLNGINLAIAWAAGVKIRVAHAHAIGSERSARGKVNVVDFIYQRMMRRFIQIFANRKCGCSKAVVQDSYSSRSCKGKYVINNGFDIDAFSQCAGAPAEKDPKVLITVGRLVPVKKPGFTIRIMDILGKQGYVLMWVGSGELEEQICLDIAKRGLSKSITMLGARKDINSLLKTASVFLLPSISEGLSIAALEAQAAGLPCVISDTVPQEVDCGLCTFLSLDESPDVWAETIDSIAAGKTTQKLDADKIEKFSTDYMLKQVVEMYRLPCYTDR